MKDMSGEFKKLVLGKGTAKKKTVRKRVKRGNWGKKDKWGEGSRKFEQGNMKLCLGKCGKYRIVEKGKKRCPVCGGKVYP